MKKVIAVVRHAQSAGKQSGQRDYDRTLTPQGELEAKALGKKIKKENISFDLILSSGARRTRQTVAAINETLAIPSQKIQFLPELYDALVIQWMEHIHGVSDDFNRLMLVGHNPWISMLVGNFSTETIELAPSEMIVLEFNVDSWTKITGPGSIILNIKST